MSKRMVSTISILLVASLSGCASAPPVRNEAQAMDSNTLVGIPIGQRIAHSEKKIEDQFSLLNKVNSGKYIGEYSVVKNNNGMDARKGSSETIPRAYADLPVEKKKADAASSAVIKEISWNNDSLNKLGRKFAEAMGYELVIKTGAVSDENVSFSIKGETLGQAAEKLGEQVSDFAQILVVSENKTFNIIYK